MNRKGKLIMCKGLPGSGKSTWASAQLGATIVNKDDIRAAMKATWSRDVEKEVLRIRDFEISLALNVGKYVISSDTNLAPKHEARLRAIARKYGASFDVQSFLDVSVDECIARDAHRDEGKVGESVIRGMWTQYLAPRTYSNPKDGVEVVAPQEPSLIVVPYVRDYSKPKALICDLDGTLALHQGRSPYDVERCDEDLLNDPIDDIIHLFSADGHAIVYLSGREEKYYDKTLAWLEENKCPKGTLRMRLTGDKRNDAIIKMELFDRCVRDVYNVSFVLDDRDRVVKMWRDLGLTCLQVGYGAF